MRFLPPGYRHYAVCLIAAAAALPAFAQHGEDRPDPQALFDTLDTDGSATLSRDELSRLPDVMAARHAARIDTNNDGQIDKTEYEAAAKARADHRFDRMDRDGDGQIGVDALDAHRGHHRHRRHHDRDHESADDKSGHKGWFEAIDNDKDGTISPEEWQTAATRWHHRRGAGHDTDPAAAHPDDA